ncbi:MAG TPA: hypothetical protein VFV65_04650 [Gemmatimonadales bacterium]|nr:hypothetical protein [Gemmatimonadales bacterium]
MQRPAVAAALIWLALAPATVGTVAAQGRDSLVLESPDTRRVVSAAEWAALPTDTMRVRFHDQPAEVYAGDERPSRWARRVVILRVRAEQP